MLNEMKKIGILACVFCLSCLLVFKEKSRFIRTTPTKEIVFEERQEETEYDHPEEFAEFQKAIRTKDGESEPGYQPGYRLKELANAQQARKAFQNSVNGKTASDNGVVEWKERGPANIPGRTRALLNLPGDVNNKTWLAGAATGGVWKTTDGGTSWVEKSKDFSVLPISSLAMSEEASTKVVYAGTGELVSTASSALGDGIFKSTDLGETWIHLSSTAGNKSFLIVTRIVVDPTNSNTLLASCVSTPYLADDNSTIQRSIDGGATWKEVYKSPASIEQLAFTPGNFNTLFATLRGTGVIKSIDGGLTWTNASVGLSPSGRIEIAISPVKPNRLFASVVGNLTGTGSDLYVSEDAATNWSLVDVSLNNASVDLLGGQGNYDNTIACDPFNQDVVYFGGVNYFRLTLGTTSTTINNYTLDEAQTSSFVSLVPATGVTFGGGKLSVYNNPSISIELRFGSGKKQKAHRFLVPAGSTSGVPDANYTYQDYVDVDFEAWDVTNNKQLMVSFRDQGRDGKFNLIPQNTDNAEATLQSREYVYVHTTAYDASTASPSITVNGGHRINAIYNVWPVLTAGATFPPTQNASLKINVSLVTRINATTNTVADAYSKWDGKNKVNQTDYTLGVHPDHHTTVIIPVDKVLKTFKFLIGNDGGIFFSNTSTTPGIVNGDLKFAGYGYNTGQFYAADKKPGADQYLGGLQDNGTRYSPNGESSSLKTNYNYALSGDGFEVLWNSLDGNKMLGSIYYGDIYKSIDGGTTWSGSKVGLANAGNSANFPFFTKLSNSKKFPDRVFTIGASGVFVSNDFGSNWTLTPINSNLSGASFFADVEVSQSNASIVWAGSGMSSTRNLFVSTDGGKSFSKTTNYSGASLGGLTRLASHPTQDNTAFALFSFADSPKILRTKDLGQTWEDISGFGSGTSSANGFPNVGVFCLYVRPDNPNIIWAGTEVGIVESLDDGKTWNILNEFPNVNVWDMKGQDDQIVIATHGRGIWTAKTNSQQVITSRPSIITSGTTPQSKYVLQFNLPVKYDAVDVVLNGTTITTLKNQSPGSYNLTVSNIPFGVVSSQLIAYQGGSPLQSTTFQKSKLNVSAPVSFYYNFFDNNSVDFAGFNNDASQPTFAVTSLAGNNNSTSLQTAHNYPLNAELTSILIQPIIVSKDNPNLYYSEVALVANDGDFVTVEGTKDGVTWKPLIANYNSSANPTWTNAVNSNSIGTDAMQVKQSLKLTPTFAANDTILVRFRLSSNATGTAWGWSIDDLYIQQTPTGLENLLPGKNDLNFGVYPNPINAKVNGRIFYTLYHESKVQLSVSDLNGKIIADTSLGVKQKGAHEEVIPTSLEPGIYFIRIKTIEGISTKRLLVTD
jgi:photosystem II stability/assembly factor-like uncharacterized protein